MGQQDGGSAHVTFRKVQKTYDGEHLIVRDLNLDIQRGEFLTLLGPSGSGKTTCLMMLAGFETPTAGEICLGDRVINKLPPHKRNIGMVFQNYVITSYSIHYTKLYDNILELLVLTGLNVSILTT